MHLIFLAIPETSLIFIHFKIDVSGQKVGLCLLRILKKILMLPISHENGHSNIHHHFTCKRILNNLSTLLKKKKKRERNILFHKLEQAQPRYITKGDTFQYKTVS